MRQDAPGGRSSSHLFPGTTRFSGCPRRTREAKDLDLRAAILRAFGRGSHAAPWDSEEAIREELFSIERLEQHAESLAAAQPITSRPTTGRSLAGRLKENERILLAAYRSIARAVS